MLELRIGILMKTSLESDVMGASSQKGRYFQMVASVTLDGLEVLVMSPVQTVTMATSVRSPANANMARATSVLANVCVIRGGKVMRGRGSS